MATTEMDFLNMGLSGAYVHTETLTNIPVTSAWGGLYKSDSIQRTISGLDGKRFIATYVADAGTADAILTVDRTGLTDTIWFMLSRPTSVASLSGKVYMLIFD